MPKYETTLPMTNKKVTYRPFNVREEKILLLAQEENNVESYIRAMNQIIQECTFDVHSIDTLNKVDAEFLYIQLRNKSLGEGVDVNGICTECDKRTRITMNLENIKVRNAHVMDAVQLNDTMWVQLKLPTMKDALSINDTEGNEAIARCLDTIIIDDNSYNASEYTAEERFEFVESLTSFQISKFKPFFDTFPAIEYDFDYKCQHCGADNHVHIEGIENFFV